MMQTALYHQLKVPLWFRRPIRTGYDVPMRDGQPQQHDGVVLRSTNTGHQAMELGGFSVLQRMFTIFLLNPPIFRFTDAGDLRLNDQGVRGLDAPSADDVKDARDSVFTIIQIDKEFGALRLLCEDTTRRIT